MLAGFIHLDEGPGVPGKLRPDTFITNLFGSFPKPTQDRWSGQIRTDPIADIARSHHPGRIMVTLPHRGN